MTVAVIGAGSWGTAVAGIAAANTDVRLWARRAELAEQLDAGRENADYLPGFALPPRLEATADLEVALSEVEAVVMAVPSHGYRTVLEQAAEFVPPGAPIVSLTKGIEQDTLMRMTEVTGAVLPRHDQRTIGVLTGPNLAKEVAAGQPAASVIAMENEATAVALQAVLMSPSFRVYTNPDVVGAESAGALKNVMAIAAGLAHGLGFGDNTIATLITRALAEITRLGVAMGGRPLTFAGLAGTGDLIATCISDKSRNHRVGYGLGQGRTLDEIVGEMNMVAEGVKSTRAVLDLAGRHGIEMPIAEQVGLVLYEGKSPAEVVMALMGRAAKSELYGID
jgi:glycerol-3-phosphate dehydrogenase (NAD(P)+)